MVCEAPGGVRRNTSFLVVRLDIIITNNAMTFEDAGVSIGDRPDRGPSPEEVELADGSRIITLFQQSSEAGVIKKEEGQRARDELRALAKENPGVLLACEKKDPDEARKILAPHIAALRKQMN